MLKTVSLVYSLKALLVLFLLFVQIESSCANDRYFDCENNSELTLSSDSLAIAFPEKFVYTSKSGVKQDGVSRKLCFFFDPQKFTPSKYPLASDLIFFDSSRHVNCDYTGVIIFNIKTFTYAKLNPSTFEFEAHKCVERTLEERRKRSESEPKLKWKDL